MPEAPAPAVCPHCGYADPTLKRYEPCRHCGRVYDPPDAVAPDAFSQSAGDEDNIAAELLAPLPAPPGWRGAALLSIIGAGCAAVVYAMLMPEASWSHVWSILGNHAWGKMFVVFFMLSFIFEAGAFVMISLRLILGKW